MAGRRIAITGASGYLAKCLLDRLERDQTVERIPALDVRPLERNASDKIVFVNRSINDPLDALLEEHNVDSIVHLAFVLNPGRRRDSARRVNVEGTANLIDACLKASVRHMLYLSSTSVYGAYADSPTLMDESVPVRPLRGFQYSEDKVSAELLINEAARKNADFKSTILRVCPVMGANADNFIAHAFSKPFLVGVKGCDPDMQLIHEDDLVEAVLQCLADQTPGVFNLASESTIRWSEMAQMYGRRLVNLPAPILYGLVGLSWTLGLQSDSPPSGLNFIRYGVNVSTEKINDTLGFAPRYTSREAWQAFVERAKSPALSESRRS